MNKVAALLLMGILLFNWCGYQFLHTYLESRADSQLQARLDNENYDPAQLISIKIPATRLSYYNSSPAFERVDGQIEVDGIQYRYVKRRLFNDSLELLCIPNQMAMKLNSAKNEFFKLVNDLQQHNEQGKRSPSHPGSSKSFSSLDTYALNDQLTIGGLWFVNLQPSLQAAILHLPFNCSSPAERPPDRQIAVC